jgi:hypothetical protein
MFIATRSPTNFEAPEERNIWLREKHIALLRS